MELKNMKSLRLFAVMLLMLITGCLSPAFGQSDRGTIRGTVTDPSGAIVPNARVVLTGAETGEVREVTTTDEGAYVFPELRPATYNITVESAGFNRAAIKDFK